MFDDIFFPHTVRRYQAAPLVKPRERYLVHLAAVGTRPSTLRKCANNQLALVSLLDLRDGDRVTRSRTEAAAALWAQPKGRRFDRAAMRKTREGFVSRGVRWLAFLGWLEEADDDRHSHDGEVRAYERWLHEERDLSEETVRSYVLAADHFFGRLAAVDVRLSTITIADIDDALAAEHRRGAWNHRTRHDYVQRLRAFFLFTEKRGWCWPGLAAGVKALRVMTYEIVPKGLRRENVVRLLASVKGERPVDKRDRAILMLFVGYGRPNWMR